MDKAYKGLTEMFIKTRRTPTNIRINLLSPENTVWVYIYCFNATVFKISKPKNLDVRKQKKTEFNVKSPFSFTVIQGHAFWSPSKGDKGVNTI